MREERLKINNQITSNQVRLVGEIGNNEIVSLKQALRIADDNQLDLIEINPKADPPVCKIMDYQKFMYEKKKKAKDSVQAKQEIKEIRFTPNTDEHDFNFKLNHAKNFLQRNDRVKATVFFKGREIKLAKDTANILLLKFANELIEYGTAESMPLLEGKKMIILIRPKKK